MRNFNNWVKVAIITKYCDKNYSVLDLCGGKGGDLLKFREEKIGHYVLAGKKKKKKKKSQKKPIKKPIKKPLKIKKMLLLDLSQRPNKDIFQK